MPTYIHLDAGHGGHDPGAVQLSKPTLNEKDVTLAVTSRLGQLLEGEGMIVSHARTDDRFVSLSDRVRLTRESKAELFVSVHCNAAVDTSATGMEVWVSAARDRDDDANLAQLVLSSMLDAHPGHNDRGVRRGNFYVLTKAPDQVRAAVLVEMEFISNFKQSKFLRENIESLAQSICRGIVEFVNQRDRGLK